MTTQFITNDGTASSTLVNITRKYIQNGVQVKSAVSAGDTITASGCSSGQAYGGLTTMGQSLGRGMSSHLQHLERCFAVHELAGQRQQRAMQQHGGQPIQHRRSASRHARGILQHPVGRHRLHNFRLLRNPGSSSSSSVTASKTSTRISTSTRTTTSAKPTCTAAHWAQCVALATRDVPFAPRATPASIPMIVSAPLSDEMCASRLLTYEKGTRNASSLGAAISSCL